MSLWSQFIKIPFDQFIQGLTCNVSGCYEYWFKTKTKDNKYTKNHLRNLLLSILVSMIVFWCCLIPIHILFYVFRTIIFLLSYLFIPNDFNDTLSNVHSQMTFYNLFFDCFWYLPLIVLLFARYFKILFDTNETFYKHLRLKYPSIHETFVQVPVESTQTKLLQYVVISLKQICKLIFLSFIIFLLKLGFRKLQQFLSVLVIIYTQYYRKMMKFNNPKLLSIKYGEYYAKYVRYFYMFCNVLFCIVMFYNVYNISFFFLRFYEWYIASIQLSYEFLNEYFIRIKSYKYEKYILYKNGWYFCGFGTIILISFYIPFVGLLLYPTFQYASVNLLIAILKQSKIDYQTDDKEDLFEKNTINLAQEPIITLLNKV